MIPAILLNIIDVFIVLRSFFLSSAPKYFAKITLVPVEIPRKNPTSRFIKAPDDPTAARGMLPANIPTIELSTALYSC
jgi:hypothetical protein